MGTTNQLYEVVFFTKLNSRVLSLLQRRGKKGGILDVTGSYVIFVRSRDN